MISDGASYMNIDCLPKVKKTATTRAKLTKLQLKFLPLSTFLEKTASPNGQVSIVDYREEAIGEADQPDDGLGDEVAHDGARTSQWLI